MATVDQLDGNMLVRGAMTVTGSVNVSTGAVSNGHIAESAGIAASKYTRHQTIDVQVVASTDTIANAVHLLHIVHAPASLRKFSACCVTPTTAVDRVVTVDLRNNMAGDDFSSLTGLATFGTTSEPYVPQVGTLTTDTTLANGHILYAQVATTGSSGTQARGLIVSLVMEEDYI